MAGEQAWPFVRTQKYGLITLHNPPFSHRLGPWPLNGDLTPLLRALPYYHRLIVSCRPEGQPILPDFRGSTRQAPSHTLCWPQPTTEAALLASYSKSWRKHVRHGQSLKLLENEMPLGADSLFARVLEAGGARPLPTGLIQKIQQAIAAGQISGKLWVALQAGQPVATALVAWDHARTYYLANGRMPEETTRGAVHALTHQAILESIAAGRVFDFMGSWLPGVANFNQGFGATPVPYTQLNHMRHPIYRIKAWLDGYRARSR